MTAEKTPCPAGCGNEQKPGKLLCWPCWSSVPLARRREVNRTWAVYRRARANEPILSSKRGDALRAYRAARDAALLSIGVAP